MKSLNTETWQTSVPKSFCSLSVLNITSRHSRDGAHSGLKQVDLLSQSVDKGCGRQAGIAALHCGKVYLPSESTCSVATVHSSKAAE